MMSVLRPTLYSNIMSAPAIAVFGFLYLRCRQFALTNLATQLAVFVPLVQLPALLTGRLSYVDLAWPTGLFAMGLVGLARALSQLVRGGAPGWRAVLVAVQYIFQGGRMALGAWTMWAGGHLKTEMQRYKFQRLRWAANDIRPGSLAETVEIQKEAFTQCLANLGPLAVPLAASSLISGPVQRTELLGWAVWCGSFVLEHSADVQKMGFGRAMKRQGLRKQVCDWGMWNYSRHPNYFGEWGVWVGLALSSWPAVQQASSGQQSSSERPGWLEKLQMAAAVLAGPVAMYICLVHWTGAVPAEYYSITNRPGYAQYCKEVNCFFPGPRVRALAR